MVGVLRKATFQDLLYKGLSSIIDDKEDLMKELKSIGMTPSKLKLELVDRSVQVHTKSYKFACHRY